MSAFHVTVFPDLGAKTMLDGAAKDFATFARSLTTVPEYADKPEMPLLCPMTFDGKATDKGCLRSDESVVLIYGACGDHDAGTMSIKDATARMKKAGIECVLYTTPTHTEAAPRWRVIVPFFKATKDHKAHLHAVERMNHVLDGALKHESFTLSQSFYFGRVAGRDYTCLYVKGKRIDRMVAIPRRGSDGGAKTGDEKTAKYTQAENARRVTSGDDIHNALNSLIASKLMQGIHREDVATLAHALIDEANADPERKATRHGEVERSIEGAIRKFNIPQSSRPRGNVVALPVRAPQAPSTGETPAVVQFLRDWVPLDPDTVKPVTFYVDGLIEERRSVGLVAPGGTGKTSMLMDLAIATALGTDWYGMRVRQGTFVLMSLDDLQEDLDGAFMEFMHAKGLTPAEQHTVRNHVQLRSMIELPEYVAFAMETREGGVIATSLANDIIAGLLHLTDLRCVVMDTVRHFSGGDTNSSRVMTVLTKALGNISAMLHCATIGPHHMTKVGARSGDIDQYIGSGSAAFGDNLRVILSLRTTSVEELADNISIERGDMEVLRAYQILRLDDTRGSLRRKVLPTIWVKRDGYKLTRIDGRKLGAAEKREVQMERVIEAVKRGATSAKQVRLALKISDTAATALVNEAIARGKLLKKNKTSPLSVPT